MTDELDDEIDRLLSAQFDGPVAADGFAERVMEQLPARRRRNWPLAVGATAGVALGWLSLLSAPLTRTAWQDWLSGNLTDAVLTLLAVMIGGAVLALTWSIAETNDGAGPLARSRLP